MTDQPPEIPAPTSPAGEVVHTTRLSERLLVMLLEVEGVDPRSCRLLDGAPDQPLDSGSNAPEPLEARWHPLGPQSGSEDPEPSARAVWIASVLVTPEMAARESLGPLLLDDGTIRCELAARDPELVLSTAVEFARGLPAAPASADTSAALGFLLDAPAAHGVATDPELAARLATFHDELREPLPATEIRTGVGCALRLETVLALDERAYWLSGWIHDPAPRDARLVVVTPEGARAEPPQGSVSFHARPDVDSVFEGDLIPNLGFHLYIELDRPSYIPTDWRIELHTSSGHAVEDTARAPVSGDDALLRRRIGDQLKVDEPDPAVMANQVLPALARLRLDGEIEVDAIVDYGNVPATPEVSIVVPLRRGERIEHQLVQFARDPELAAAELIYVAAPELAKSLRRRGASLHELYRVPFRVVELSGRSRRPRAINLGAGVARGRLLVLFSGDVFPVDPGWLHQLRTAHATIRNVGVVGARLLHPDGSIAEAGVMYVPGAEPTRWERRLPLRGLSATLDVARGPRRVQAVSDACLMIAAAAFRGAEGMSELYLDGGDVAADLCLRLAADGLDTWSADVSLYIIERSSSWPVAFSAELARFNDWLLDRRWGSWLGDAGSARRPGAIVHEPPAGVPFPQTGSGRPGAPLEILGVTRAHPDEAWVLGAELLRPIPGSEWDSYDETYSFTVQGWAVSRSGAPVTVELREGERPLRQAITKLRRDDVLARYPDAAGADAAGFQTALSSLGLAERFRVDVDLVAEDGRRALLATIEGRRRPVRSSFAPTLQPALITTLGRTGSSWLALLLAQHPEIVAYRPFQNEARVASYWMAVLRALAEPSSYIQALRPELYQGHWWIGDQRPSPLPLQLAEPHMPRWLGGENVEVLAGFCQSRLDGFYSELARVQESTSARYFAEKCWPDEATPQLLGELYPDGREILLVRDFRDMVCSILGFNAKRGFASFGRELTDNDEEFIRNLRESALRMLDSFNQRRDRAWLVRYEDLIVDPEPTLIAIFSYLEVQADEQTVRTAIAAAHAQLPHVQRAHQTSTSVSASVGRWKHELSHEQQVVCEEAFGDILAAFGYEPTSQTSSSERSATTSMTASGLKASRS